MTHYILLKNSQVICALNDPDDIQGVLDTIAMRLIKPYANDEHVIKTSYSVSHIVDGRVDTYEVITCPSFDTEDFKELDLSPVH